MTEKQQAAPQAVGVSISPEIRPRFKIALAGNPNAGKTTLFNALTGGRAHVGNYPGITVEKRVGQTRTEHADLEIEGENGDFVRHSG